MMIILQALLLVPLAHVLLLPDLPPLPLIDPPTHYCLTIHPLFIDVPLGQLPDPSYHLSVYPRWGPLLLNGCYL